jgi:hypothetical protein
MFRGGKREANRALARLVAEIGSIGTQADQSVTGLLLAHIDHLEQRGREARAIESYRSIARKVAADRLGTRMIQDLGPRDLDDFYVGLRANGLSPASIRRYHSVLGGAFQQAMKWGSTNRNVVRLATPPAVPRQSRTTPTPTVVTALLREAVERQTRRTTSPCASSPRPVPAEARSADCGGHRSTSTVEFCGSGIPSRD